MKNLSNRCWDEVLACQPEQDERQFQAERMAELEEGKKWNDTGGQSCPEVSISLNNVGRWNFKQDHAGIVTWS